MHHVELLNGSLFDPQPINWLWPGWLAEGKLHLLAGNPGTGKTNIALAVASILSRGGTWPCGANAKATNVVIWSGEDDPQDTLVPRLLALEADMRRIIFVGNVVNRSSSRTFDPARDMALLSDAIYSLGDVGLLIVDPIVSCVSTDSHKNGEVRRALQPLVDLAQQRHCGVLGNTHLNKNSGNGRDPLERVVGSIAFAALARVVLIAAKTERENGSSRILARIKSNIGPDSGGFFYSLPRITLFQDNRIETTCVTWHGFYDGDPRDLINNETNSVTSAERSEIAEAQKFLKEILNNGPIPANQIKDHAVQAGFSWASVRRAKTTLGVISQRQQGLGAEGYWAWQFPGALNMFNIT